MNDLDPAAQEPVNEDGQVELSDLDLPRPQRVTMPAWTTRFIQLWQAPHARRRLRKAGNAGLALVVLLVIALLSGNNFFTLLANQLSGYGLFQHTAPPSTAPSLFTISSSLVHVPGQDGIACLLDTQWSPRGDAIAVLGYAYNCPTNRNEPGILNVYNARTGKLTAQWRLNDTILTIINTSITGNQGIPTPGLLATSSARAASSGSAPLPFSYIHVMWSPDERQLALSFIVSMQQRPFFGILLINVNGHFSHVIFQPPGLDQQTPIEWDVATGQAMGFTPVPPAFAYHWQADGALVPAIALSSRSQQPMSLSGMVGNPDGNAAFTAWQPGFTTFTTIAGYYGWSTTFFAWSPDGRYLIDDINLQGFYKPPDSIIPDVQALSKLKLLHNRLLSPRNVAVFELLRGSPLVSWRPDGRVLATYFARGTIVFYDSHTGQSLRTILLPSNQHILAGSLALLRWSPDGSHLLLSSSSNGLLNIWGPGQLPQL